MSALCACSASCWSVGSADEEICTDRGSLPCSCSASIAVILPSWTVTRTWALPYWVGIASPAAVPETAFEALDEEPLAGAGVGLAVAVAAGAAAAVAVGADGACAWKARMPAVPAIVALRTMGDRRKGWAPSEREGLEVDPAAGDAGALELAREP